MRSVPRFILLFVLVLGCASKQTPASGEYEQKPTPTVDQDLGSAPSEEQDPPDATSGREIDLGLEGEYQKVEVESGGDKREGAACDEDGDCKTICVFDCNNYECVDGRCQHLDDD